MSKHVCPLCRIECSEAPGIGYYCPNQNCDAGDVAIEIHKDGSVVGKHPILTGAAIIALMGHPYADDLNKYTQFTNAMSVYGFSEEDCYHIIEDIDIAYDENLQ